MQMYESSWTTTTRTFLSRGWSGTLGDFTYLGSVGDRPNTDQSALLLTQSAGLLFGKGSTNGDALSTEWMRVTANGVGIGVTNPSASLEIKKDSYVNSSHILLTETGDDFARLSFRNTISSTKFWSFAGYLNATDANSRMNFYYYNGTSGFDYISITGSGNVGIGAYNPTEKLQVSGKVKARGFIISAGADIAEPFDIENTEFVKEGMVLSLDSDNPGKLKIADKEYDKKVAGIISGANGINTGMVLSQENTIADGKYPVALTGRVYCWADASYGAIEVGDLLTTSNTAGHTMKVSNFTKAQGAIIGKAITPLKSGKGLILVLVSLQ